MFFSHASEKKYRICRRLWWGVGKGGHHHHSFVEVIVRFFSFFLFLSWIILGSSGCQNGQAFLSEGNLYIVLDNYKVEFKSGDSAWTLGMVDFKDRPLLTSTGCQQTVLNTTEGWVGTCHGGEKIKSLHLVVDEKLYRIPDDLDQPVFGDNFKFVKKSEIGSYNHTASITIGHDGLVEDFDYVVARDASNVNFMYVFMHCFTKEMLTWCAELSGGGEKCGTFSSNGDFTLAEDIRWAALYSPSSQIGAIYKYPEIYEGMDTFRNSFWERDFDKKLYFKIDPKRYLGQQFRYRVYLKAFKSPTQTWENTVKEIIKNQWLMD